VGLVFLSSGGAAAASDIAEPIRAPPGGKVVLHA